MTTPTYRHQRSEGHTLGFGLSAHSADSTFRAESECNVGSSDRGFPFLLDLFELHRRHCILLIPKMWMRTCALPQWLRWSARVTAMLAACVAGCLIAGLAFVGLHWLPMSGILA